MVQGWTCWGLREMGKRMRREKGWKIERIRGKKKRWRESVGKTWRELEQERERGGWLGELFAFWLVKVREIYWSRFQSLALTPQKRRENTERGNTHTEGERERGREGAHTNTQSELAGASLWAASISRRVLFETRGTVRIFQKHGSFSSLLSQVSFLERLAGGETRLPLLLLFLLILPIVCVYPNGLYFITSLFTWSETESKAAPRSASWFVEWNLRTKE